MEAVQESTQTKLVIVDGANMNNVIHSLNGDNGETNFGGQGQDGLSKVNNRNNQTTHEFNSRRAYTIFRDGAGNPTGIIDHTTGNLYTVGQVVTVTRSELAEKVRTLRN